MQMFYTDSELDKKLESVIGVMTCGGDCPGLNTVIYALHRVFKGQLVGITQNAINTDLSVFDVVDLSTLPRYVSMVGGTILGSIVESDLKKHHPQRFDSLQVDFQSIVERHQITALILIAGDGGIEIVSRLCASINLPMIAIPKTIDNDIQGCDFAIGFHSVVQHVTQQLDALATTIMSHKRIMVSEVMGRDAGYIALMAGMAAYADVILIPEMSYDFEALAQFVERRYKDSNAGVLVVVAEGVKNPQGQHAYIRQQRYGGIGNTLSGLLEERLNLPTRYVRLGHLQRGGEPVAFDRLLAHQMAAHAKTLLDLEKFNHMVVYHHNRIDDVPITFPIKRQVENIDDWQSMAKKLGIFLGVSL